MTDLPTTLARLAAHADDLFGGWAPERWTQTVNGRTSPLGMSIGSHLARRAGRFDDVDLPAHERVTYRTRLDLPAYLFGVELTGDELLVTLNSFWPVEIRRNQDVVFLDHIPVVANGPALFPVVDALRPGDNGQFEIDVHPWRIPLDGMWARSGLALSFTTNAILERFALVDLALARLMLAERLADSPAQHASTARAANLVPLDLESVSTAELETIWADDAPFATELSWLDEPLSQYTIHAVGHAHTDLSWLWDFEDARRAIARDIESVLDLMDDYPEFRFTHSQAAGYAAIEHDRPDLFERLLVRIAEGRFEAAALQWAEPDNNVPSGPAHVRQLAEGLRYMSASLGSESDVWIAPDAFGHAGNLPQLAVSAGARTYYHHRANRGFDVDADPRYWQAQWWRGDDGSQVLALATPLYLGPVRPSFLARDLIALGVENSQYEVCYFYGVGDHGGGPTRLDLDAIARLDSATLFPAVRCATVSEFTTALLESDSTIPVVEGESDTIFEGCYVSQARGKQWNRSAENGLLTAETLGAMAAVEVEDDLSEAWRPVLFDQFHDVLGGASVAPVYAQQAANFDESMALADSILERALSSLTVADPDATAVLNPTGQAVRAWVELEGPAGSWALSLDDGTVVPTQELSSGMRGGVVPLEAFGAATARWVAMDGGRTEGVVVESTQQGWHVSTPTYSATVDAGSGIITAFQELTTGRRMIGRTDRSPESVRAQRPDLGLGVLQLYREAPHQMSSWVHDLVESERSLIRGATVAVGQSGPLLTTVIAEHSFGSSSARLTWAFYRDLPWLDLTLDLDWHEGGPSEDGIPGLALSFGSRLPSPDLWTESHFSAVRREPDGFLRPMQRWIDIGSVEGGIAIANDNKYGVDALGPRARIHVVRSTHDPDPTADHDLVQTSRYRIQPHLGSWQSSSVLEMAETLNQPAVILSRHAATRRVLPLPETGSSVRLVGLGASDGSGLELRAYESSGQTSLLHWDSDVIVVERDLRGNELGRYLPIEGRTTVPFRMFEFKLLVVD